MRPTLPTQNMITSPPQHRMVSALHPTYKPGTPSNRVVPSPKYERNPASVKQKCSSHPGTPNLADHHKGQQKGQYPKQHRHGSPSRPPPPYAGGPLPMHSTAKISAPPTPDSRKQVTSQNSYIVTSQKHKTSAPQVSQPSSKYPVPYPPQPFPGYPPSALQKPFLGANPQATKTGNEVCFYFHWVKNINVT